MSNRSGRRVTWVAGGTRTPMGQQHYESEIQAALRRQPDAGEWDFHSVTVTSMRAKIPTARHFPAQLADRTRFGVARLIGGLTYRTGGLIHRFDLRLPPAAGPEVVTVHDLPPLRFTDEGTLPRFSVESGTRATAIICPSEFAANEIRALLHTDRVSVIPYGLSHPYDAPVAASPAELKRLGLDGPFIVHAAGATQRKNLPELARAWELLLKADVNATLVLCGPPDGRRDALFAHLPGTRLMGRLEPTTVCKLMSSAAAVVVPSIYEGFGLPALEGMACGVPVVAARCGALPEVCLGSAEMVEPDGEAIAAGLNRVLTDEALAARLRAAGPCRAQEFSWAEAARRHLDLYRSVLGD
jgi:glycosyltransferase involved in cell wall biosynthesis